jgi:alpha-L-fucosidase 2
MCSFVGARASSFLEGLMRNLIWTSILFLCLAVQASAVDRDPVLWYTHPAQRWGDALPIGNGRLGGMVFGGVAQERIQLNEDTIWNGKKRNRVTQRR